MQDNTERAKLVSSVERACGKRARFHVYYLHKGRRMYDAVFGVNTPLAAQARIIRACAELGWRVEILEVVRCDPKVKVD